MADFQVEWLTLHRRTYNGEIPAATWRIKRGDKVNLHLNNTLTEPEKLQPFNGFRFTNSTNIHTHGLHISSREPEDNIFVHLKPGQSYNYKYNIDPDNPPGTYWYHSHLHGASLFQVHSGMAGMIIVDDVKHKTPDHLWKVSCPEHCEHDIQLVFQPILEYRNLFGNGFSTLQMRMQDNQLFWHTNIISSGGTLAQWLARNIYLYTVNGQVNPVVAMPTGQTKRFRMVNAGGTIFLAVMIYDMSDQVTDGCSVLEIANDGIYLDKAAFPKSGRTFIVPSGKVDWLVVCNKPGTYKVRSLYHQSDLASTGRIQLFNDTMFTINVTGSPANTKLETELPKRIYFVGDFREIPQCDVKGRFVVEAGQWFHLNREKFKSHDYYRYNSEVNQLQEWYFINTDTDLGHPIHMHINHFQVISYNKYTGGYAVATLGTNDLVYFNKEREKCYYQHLNYTGNENVTQPANPFRYFDHDIRYKETNGSALGYSEVGIFKDTLLIPPQANITVRFVAHKYTGEVVIHCHLLSHEDSGMLMTTYISEPGTQIKTHTPSGNAYPGTCNKTDVFPFYNFPPCEQERDYVHEYYHGNNNGHGHTYGHNYGSEYEHSHGYGHEPVHSQEQSYGNGYEQTTGQEQTTGHEHQYNQKNGQKNDFVLLLGADEENNELNDKNLDYFDELKRKEFLSRLKQDSIFDPSLLF